MEDHTTLSIDGWQIDPSSYRISRHGSVRRAGDQVRINTQLIDAATGDHLWAERNDLRKAGILG